MSSGRLRPSMWERVFFVSTHAEIIVHSYKNGLSNIFKNGQSILVRIDSYFRVTGDLRVIEKHVKHVDIWCMEKNNNKI